MTLQAKDLEAISEAIKPLTRDMQELTKDIRTLREQLTATLKEARDGRDDKQESVNVPEGSGV